MKNILTNIFAMVHHHSKSLLIFYLASFNLYAVEADSKYWRKIGPEGAYVRHFISNQQQTEVIYVSYNDYANSIIRYFKSINGGHSWVALPEVPRSVTSVTHKFPFNLQKSLAVDFENPNILYSYSPDGFLKSTDNALHWQLLGSDLNINTSSFFPLNPFITQSLRVLTNTDESFVFGKTVSEDGGQHWTATEDRIHLQSAENNAEIRIETSDPGNPALIYGVSYSFGDFGVPLYPPFPHLLYKSSNGGLNWINITPAGKAYSAWSIILTDDSDKLYATFGTSEYGGEEQTLVSHNGGLDWESLGTPSENSVGFNLFKVYKDPVDPQILYANLDTTNREERNNYPNRIAKSYYAGESWQVIDVSPYQPGEIVVNAQNNQQLLMTSDQGILRSENGGEDWLPSNTGMQELGGGLSIAKDNSAVMYLVTGPRYLPKVYYKSINGGQQWERFTTQDLEKNQCSIFLINPNNNEDITCGGSSLYTIDGERKYSFSDNILRRTKNGGKNWSTIANIIDRLDPDSPISFQEFTFSGLPVLDPVNENILYAMVFYNQSKRLYKSVNYAKTWQLLIDDTLSGQLLIHPLNPERLIYIIGSEKALLSENAGESWEEIPMNLQAIDFSGSDFIFDSNNQNGLLATVSGGVYYSNDLGAHWELIDEGLKENNTVNLIPTPEGVFAYSDAGIYKLSEKTDIPDISDCLFQWAETNYPSMFNSGSGISQQWGGYTYRYYPTSNTYLGIFYSQEVHLNRADLSSKIDVIGSVNFYQELAGC